MQRTMVGINLRGKILNEEIRITDVLKRITELNIAGNIARQDPTRCANRFVRWRPRITRRNVGRSQEKTGVKQLKIEKHGKIWKRPTFKRIRTI